MRALIRLAILFVNELRKGNPYAQFAVAGVVVVTLFWGLLWFARRPLGGDPEKPSVDDSAFQDENNPYRKLP